MVGLVTIAPALTHLYWLALIAWGLRAGALSLFNINAYSLAQTIVPNSLLGRVIIFTRVLTWSTASIGALLGGFAIQQTKNVGLVYVVVGSSIFLIALAFSFTPLGHTEQYLPNYPLLLPLAPGCGAIGLVEKTGPDATHLKPLIPQSLFGCIPYLFPTADY